MNALASTDLGDRNDHITSLMKGAIDLHVHSGPSVMPRSLDHIEAIEDASKAQMRAVCFKDHWYMTVPAVDLIKKHYPSNSTEALGGIVLNNAVGGLNPHAVDHCLKLGGRMVWMPTTSAANHVRHTYRHKSHHTRKPMMSSIALTVVDDRGRLLDTVKQILDIIAEHDAMLAAGHLHISEIIPLYEEAKKCGVKRRLLNHPMHIIDTKLEDMRDLARDGVFMEFCVNSFIECRSKRHTHEELRTYIDTAGIEQSFFGSDLGQSYNPRPADGYRQMINVCIDVGFSDDEIRQLFAINAARCAGLGKNTGSGSSDRCDGIVQNSVG